MTALVIACATLFGPSALDAGNPDDHLACSYPARLDLTTIAVASYSLPCGAWLEVCAADKCIRAQVLDRGPRRSRCRVEGDDPKCLIPGFADDLDLSFAAGVALGIGDANGHPTKACRGVKGRGCAVTWRRMEDRS